MAVAGAVAVDAATAIAVLKTNAPEATVRKGTNLFIAVLTIAGDVAGGADPRMRLVRVDHSKLGRNLARVKSKRRISCGPDLSDLSMYAD
jgi:hypothetical protein